MKTKQAFTIKSLLLFVLKYSITIAVLFSNSIALAQSYRSRLGKTSARADQPNYRTGIYFDTNISYTYEKVSTSPALASDHANTIFITDLKLGYIFTSGVYLGGGYSFKNYNYTNWDTEGNATFIGGGFFTNSDFDFRAYYRFDESYGDYRSGTGYMLEVNYTRPMSRQVYLGFGLNYKDITYKSNAAIPSFSSANFKNFAPALVLGVSIN